MRLSYYSSERSVHLNEPSNEKYFELTAIKDQNLILIPNKVFLDPKSFVYHKANEKL